VSFSGLSRAPAVVVAYLMSPYAVSRPKEKPASLANALKLFTKLRLPSINKGFMSQLELWERMGGQVKLTVCAHCAWH